MVGTEGLVNVGFRFSLRAILFESSLYVTVYEDIPLNLLNKSGNLKSIEKIQNFFFSNFDEHLKKLSGHHFFTGGDCKLNNETLKREIKNVLSLRLGEIKPYDTQTKQVTKQIIENLHESKVNDEQFQFYMKYCSHSTTQSQFQSDSENRFYLFGLFFLNYPTSHHSPTLQSQPSNRLVFILFNCVPDNVKVSMINSHSNTYLILKPLYSASHRQSQHQFQKGISSTLNSEIKFTDVCKFYYAKSASDVRKQGGDSQSGAYPSFKSTTEPTNMIKKIYSMSETLKFYLINPVELFLNYVDFIEENCANSYIKSVIHYLGVNAVRRKVSNTDDSDQERESQFDSKSIGQLLKIGRKMSLEDIDVTDYIRLICSHVKKKRNGQKSSYDINEKTVVGKQPLIL